MRHDRPHWAQLHAAIDSPRVQFHRIVSGFDLIGNHEDSCNGSESKLQAWPSDVVNKIASPINLIGCLALSHFLHEALTVDQRRDLCGTGQNFESLSSVFTEMDQTY